MPSFFGATERATLMLAAIAAATAEETQRRKFMDRNTLEAFSESYRHTKLGALDRRYYATPEDLNALWLKAIRERPLYFVTRPGSTK
jgi:hypothetical protein